MNSALNRTMHKQVEGFVERSCCLFYRIRPSACQNSCGQIYFTNLIFANDKFFAEKPDTKLRAQQEAGRLSIADLNQTHPLLLNRITNIFKDEGNLNFIY